MSEPAASNQAALQAVPLAELVEAVESAIWSVYQDDDATVEGQRAFTEILRRCQLGVAGS